jgi:hypothetical protein
MAAGQSKVRVFGLVCIYLNNSHPFLSQPLSTRGKKQTEIERQEKNREGRQPALQQHPHRQRHMQRGKLGGMTSRGCSLTQDSGGEKLNKSWEERLSDNWESGEGTWVRR